MCHLAELMDSVPWWTFMPAPELLADQPGRDDPRLAVVAARGDGGRLGIVYVPRGSRLRLNVQAIGEHPRGTWVDPRTESRAAVELASDGVAALPDGEDWVLLLEDLPARPETRLSPAANTNPG
jgi:hypothetical protein